MIKISIIGGGQVATHLAHIFLQTRGIQLVQMYNRSIKSIIAFKEKVPITDDITTLQESDICIISISDRSIASVSESINLKDTLIVHTSGSIAMDVLKKHKRHGVFYPLQTFSKEKEVFFKEIPLCIEANTSHDFALLKKLSGLLSERVYFIDSHQRKKLHIAAVFVNNFVNHLYQIGSSICSENKIDPTILQPLIRETTQKILQLSPYDAQTGPAKRGDKAVIQNHLSELTGNRREIYKLLSQSIAHLYGKKL